MHSFCSQHSATLFLTIFTLLTQQCLISAAKCHVDDESGLLSFKSGIKSDPSGMLNSWISGTDCCTWLGISCSPDGTRVTEFSLYGQYMPDQVLSGTISPSLYKLKYLSSLSLQNLGNLSGPFPSSIFKLPNILSIELANNKLSGKFPELSGNLTLLNTLRLQGNRLSGPIPSSIGKLTHLTQLNISSNLLSGTIPKNIQQLKNLSSLSLMDNQLTGNIPDIFKSFNKLGYLQLSHNKLTGKIPGSISALAPNLIFLELGHNALSGVIPDFLGQFRPLDTLDLSWNRFSGTVPKSFANLTKIFNLDLSHNALVDPFPVMNVKGIESLDLSYNNFHLVNIPKWVTTSTIIYSLKLAKCGIKMKLDDWNPTQTYFYDYIDLSDNNITGSPVKLLNRTDRILGFYASGNKLKFNLESLKTVNSLIELDLSRNLVFGKVPKVISGLNMLNVSHNHLCGKLPATNFPASSFVGNDCLCGSPLPACKV